MEKKGISPVIATVLLIVVAIALFLLIFLWLRGFQKEAILKYGTPIETVCTSVSYTAMYSGGALQVTNTGSTTINQLKIYGDGKDANANDIGQLMPAASGQTSVTCTKNIKIVPYLLGTTQSGVQREAPCAQQTKTIPCTNI